MISNIHEFAHGRLPDGRGCHRRVAIINEVRSVRNQAWKSHALTYGSVSGGHYVRNTFMIYRHRAEPWIYEPLCNQAVYPFKP
ncbi:MAG TPA: hypothetical protein VGL19_24370 [Polyangiaceae bacterium]